jgi:hypothetical protein
MADDDEILGAAYPDLKTTVCSERLKKIKQVAVIAADACGLKSLLGPDGCLLTLGLEDLGKVVIFADKQKMLPSYGRRPRRNIRVSGWCTGGTGGARSMRTS